MSDNMSDDIEAILAENATLRSLVRKLADALKNATDIACARCQTANGINCDFENTPYRACLPMGWRALVAKAKEVK